MLKVWERLYEMQVLAAPLDPKHLPALQVAMIRLEETIDEAKKAWRRSLLLNVGA